MIVDKFCIVEPGSFFTNSQQSDCLKLYALWKAFVNLSPTSELFPSLCFWIVDYFILNLKIRNYFTTIPNFQCLEQILQSCWIYHIILVIHLGREWVNENQALNFHPKLLFFLASELSIGWRRGGWFFGFIEVGNYFFFCCHVMRFFFLAFPWKCETNPTRTDIN